MPCLSRAFLNDALTSPACLLPLFSRACLTAALLPAYNKPHLLPHSLFLAFLLLLHLLPYATSPHYISSTRATLHSLSSLVALLR